MNIKKFFLIIEITINTTINSISKLFYLPYLWFLCYIYNNIEKYKLSIRIKRYKKKHYFSLLKNIDTKLYKVIKRTDYNGDEISNIVKINCIYDYISNKYVDRLDFKFYKTFLPIGDNDWYRCKYGFYNNTIVNADIHLGDSFKDMSYNIFINELVEQYISIWVKEIICLLKDNNFTLSNNIITINNSLSFDYKTLVFDEEITYLEKYILKKTIDNIKLYEKNN